MTIKDRLINELEQTPEPIVQEVFDFLQFLKFKESKMSQTATARSVLQQLVAIGRKQQPCDVVQVCRDSRDDLQNRGLE